ncbi:MAG: DUF1045 domain-containing protein [Pseudomonadota bacterium]
MTFRYAVYFAPAASHALWHAGCDWLGRDARAGMPLSPPAQPQVGSPWRYGFHATLKAPCRLQVAPPQWLAQVQALAQRHARFAMPALQVAMLGDFLALRPVQPLAADHPLRRLADDCVLTLDSGRAPADAAERERQLRGDLSMRQREQVERYGYAHVLDDWRLHFTLTDSLGALDAGTVQMLQRKAEAHFAEALRAPLLCDALSVFVQPAPGAPFQRVHRFALGGG